MKTNVSLLIVLTSLFMTGAANACTAYGIFLDRDSSDLVQDAIKNSYSVKYKDFKDESMADRNTVTLSGIDEGVGSVTFSISTAADKTSTLIATSPSGNVIKNPYGIHQLVFEAVGLPSKWSLAQAMYEVYVNNACEWK